MVSVVNKHCFGLGQATVKCLSRLNLYPVDSQLLKNIAQFPLRGQQLGSVDKTGSCDSTPNHEYCGLV